MAETERVTLHFDLGHCPKDVEFTLRAGGGRTFRLTPYADAPGKLDEHRRKNKALALIPGAQLHRITHFVEDAEMSADRVSRRSVVYPSRKPGALLPEIALIFIHIPTEHRRRAFRDMRGRGLTLPHNNVLRHYGVAPHAAAGEDEAAIRADAGRILPPHKTAESIVFHHPEIASVNPAVAAYVLDKHIRGQAFDDLVDYISNNGPETTNSWYQHTVATGLDPKTGKEFPIPANQTPKDSKGNVVQVNWPQQNGQPVIPQYQLTDRSTASDGGVLGAAAPVVSQVLIDTKNDLALNGQLWTKQHGTTQKSRTKVDPAPAPRAARALRAATKGWTIKNQTSSYGLGVYPDQLTYDAGSNTISFPVQNWPNRYLGAYVKFVQSDGTAIPRSSISGWNDPFGLSTELTGSFEPDPTKNYLTWLGAGNQIFGIPIFVGDTTTLEFKWPQAATKAEVLIGGFGAAGGFRDWDSSVDVLGVVGTGVIAYGLQAFGLLFSAKLDPVLKTLSRTQTIAVYGVSIGIGIIAGVVGAVETAKGSSVGPTILAFLANKVAGILFGNLVKLGIEKAFFDPMVEIVGETFTLITAEEALEEAPFAGWVVRIASVASTLAAMAATTIECLASPATYRLEILHTMDLTVTVSPDPAHGTATQKPIWPRVGDTYQICVTYPAPPGQEGGTTYTVTGDLPQDRTAPISVTFEGIPAGGKFNVTADIYSETNWLAGRWSSGAINATPDSDDQLAVSGSIKENLVPLTATTTYSPNQRLAYDAGSRKHVWQTAQSAPKLPTVIENCGTDGDNHNMCRRVGMTLNDKEYQLGYVWQASGQNLALDDATTPSNGQMYAFQSISTLGQPEDEIIEPGRGFSQQPYLAYNQFGLAALLQLPLSPAQAELDHGGAVPSDLAKQLGEGLPAGAQVTVVAKGSEWLLGVPKQDPVYVLRVVEALVSDQWQQVINVYSYPAPEVDNFWLDPRAVTTDGFYHLRGVTFQTGRTTFDYTTGKSWGAFSQANLNAVAVHPHGSVVGIDFANHKLHVLHLPENALPEHQAPIALPLSGQGSREGLMYQPVAMTIAADGRILVLEQGNQRIQAFDLKANPVPCFNGSLSFTLPATFAPELDSRSPGADLAAAFQRNVTPALAPLFSGDADSASALDNKTVDASLSKAFAAANCPLPADTGKISVAVTQPGALWFITDTSHNATYDVRLTTDHQGARHLFVYRSASLIITVKAPGSEWMVADAVNAMTFDVKQAASSATTLHVQQLVATMSLRKQTGNVTYQDVATETKGYIYVLASVAPASGSTVYQLDIYNPDGTALLATPQTGMNAAKLAVDQWRSLFTLDYDTVLGPGARTEPGVTVWIPSTPKG
ncbi:conserved membrane hypothetical protein [Bradyrhizobium sp. ORS 375]|nr:conserved membrane hypothetical protein [Bradyrhizobium sp. ORS 375]